MVGQSDWYVIFEARTSRDFKNDKSLELDV